MHGGEGDAPAAQIGDRARDGFRNVEHLEIREDLVAALEQPFDELEIAIGDEELEADLIEARRGTNLFRQRSRFCRARHIERDDQPVMSLRLLRPARHRFPPG